MSIFDASSNSCVPPCKLLPHRHHPSLLPGANASVTTTMEVMVGASCARTNGSTLAEASAFCAGIATNGSTTTTVLRRPLIDALLDANSSAALYCVALDDGGGGGGGGGGGTSGCPRGAVYRQNPTRCEACAPGHLRDIFVVSSDGASNSSGPACLVYCSAFEDHTERSGSGAGTGGGSLDQPVCVSRCPANSYLDVIIIANARPGVAVRRRCVTACPTGTYQDEESHFCGRCPTQAMLFYLAANETTGVWVEASSREMHTIYHPSGDPSDVREKPRCVSACEGSASHPVLVPAPARGVQAYCTEA
jgi:hypothetical protein